MYDTHVYDSWGGVRWSSGTGSNDGKTVVIEPTYTGHPYDPILGIYFAEARFYDAANRQWLASDPIKSDEYVGSNPTTFWDPTGLYYIIETTNSLTGETYYKAIPEGPINVILRAADFYSKPNYNAYGSPYEIVGGNSNNYDDVATIILEDTVETFIEEITSELVSGAIMMAAIYYPPVAEYAEPAGEIAGFAIVNLPGFATSEHWEIRKNDEFLFETFDEFKIGVTNPKLEQLEIKMEIATEIAKQLYDPFHTEISVFGKNYWEVMEIFGRSDVNSKKQQEKLLNKFMQNQIIRDNFYQSYLSDQSGYVADIFRNYHLVNADKDTKEIVLQIMETYIKNYVENAQSKYLALQLYFKKLFCYNTIV